MAKTAKFVCIRDFGGAPPSFGHIIDGKAETVYPDIGEDGFPYYEGSIEFVKHFVSTDPKWCKLAPDQAPMIAAVRDGMYDISTVKCLPHQRVSRQVVVGEDSDGNEISEYQYSWEPIESAAHKTVAPVPASGTTISEAFNALKARMIAIIGEDAWPEYVKSFRASVGREKGSFSSDNLAELGRRVRAAEESVE